MKRLDLHGKSHEDSRQLVEVFIENNIDNLPIQIITGNSVDMQTIVKKVAVKHNLKTSPKTYYNLGCLIINDN